MGNKLGKKLVFFIYTFIIYNLFVFPSLPLLLYRDDLDNMIGYLEVIAYIYFWVICAPFKFDWGSSFAHGALEETIIVFFAPFILYCLPFVYWIKKQTVCRAWIISMLGLIAGPGLTTFLWIPLGNADFPAGPVIMALFCLFYFLLWKGDKWQKKHFPQSKLAARIRFLITWPCIRT